MVGKIVFYSFILIILGTVLFFLGFHDIDLAFNMLPNEIDRAYIGKSMAKNEIYSLGLMFMLLAFMLFISAYLMVISLISDT